MCMRWRETNKDEDRNRVLQAAVGPDSHRRKRRQRISDCGGKIEEANSQVHQTRMDRKEKKRWRGEEGGKRSNDSTYYIIVCTSIIDAKWDFALHASSTTM